MIAPELISRLELKYVMKSEGVELHRSGKFLCPFHDDHRPSGSISNYKGKQRWHCFSCNEGGDAIDFIRKRYGLDFKGALSYLGIESGRLTRAQIRKNKQKRKIKETFKSWELAAIDQLRDTIFLIYRVSGRFKTVEDLELYGGILDPLAGLQGCLDVLMTGPKKDRIGIYNHWKARGGFF